MGDEVDTQKRQPTNKELTIKKGRKTAKNMYKKELNHSEQNKRRKICCLSSRRVQLFRLRSLYYHFVQLLLFCCSPMVLSVIHLYECAFFRFIVKEIPNTSTEARNSRSQCVNVNYNTIFFFLLIA